MAADDWWLIMATPDSGQHLWCIGVDPNRPDLAELVAAARLTAGYPAGDGVPAGGWSVHLSPGEPHPKLLAAATVHDVAELVGHDKAAVAAYQAASVDVMREQRIEATLATIAQMSDADRDAVLAALTKE